MWHGYAVLEKPVDVTATEWNTALSTIRANLNGTPDDPQPANRLHTRPSGDRIILESNFDATKINPAYLYQLTGFTPNILPMRQGDVWGRSLDLCHEYMADGWDWEMTRTFRPEDYGAVGDGVADDAPSIQRAIDDASQNGGAVQLSRRYRITVQGSIELTLGSIQDYALWVQADNVAITGPGTLVVTEKQDSVRFTGLLFGRLIKAEYPDRPGSTGPWLCHAGISGVRFDATALSEADLLDMAGNGFVQTVVFAYCRDWWICGCVFDNCWGGNGVLGSHSSSRDGLIDGNITYGGIGHQAMIWVDGAQGTRIVNNKICRAHFYGIVVQTNLDNCDINDPVDGDAGFCYDNIVANNHVGFGAGHSTAVGIGLVGSSRSMAVNNYLHALNPGYGVEMRAYAHHHNNSKTNDCLVSGNVGINLVRGVWMWGHDESPLDGSPVTTERNVVIGNYFTRSDVWPVDCYLGVLGEQVQGNVIANNVAKCDIEFDVNETATGNTLEPNILL